MTSNQIQYWRNQEEARHNRATEEDADLNRVVEKQKADAASKQADASEKQADVAAKKQKTEAKQGWVKTITGGLSSLNPFKISFRKSL